MPALGFDAYITELGVAEEKTCRVCGAACECERAVFGPISFPGWVEAQQRYHDRFVCPHAHQLWHRQALRRAQASPTFPPRFTSVARV
jgi:hypothetical protein